MSNCNNSSYIIKGIPERVIENTDRGEQGLAVYVQDQTTPILDVSFLQTLGTFEVIADLVVNANLFTAVSGHSIVTGNVLEFAVAGTGRFMQSRVLTVVGDVITIDTPINYPYKTTDIFVRSSDDLRVDGSVTPQVFRIAPSATQAGDLVNVNLIIESTNQMDYSKFGSLPALLRGCVLRYNHGDGTYRNLLNWKTNGDFIIESFGHYFEQKAGGGQYGFLSRLSYGGQHNRGVVIRLDGRRSESLELVIQDNLIAPSLTVFRMIAYGSEIQGY